MQNAIKFSIAGAIVAAVILTSLPLSEGIGAGNATAPAGPEQKTIRIGYFASLGHAPAVIGLGNGDYKKHFQGDVEVKAQVFDSGPSAIEALFANQIDVAYVGPNPTINGYMQSHGDAFRVIAGTASGGVLFVVRNDSGIQSVHDFAGKTFASPQLGNTQDVALRSYLVAIGYRPDGDVKVLPATNSDIMTLMQKKSIDGAWVPEPWGTRLVHEANAHVFLDERSLWKGGQFVTTNLIARTDFLQRNPTLIKNLLEATVDETNWINSHPDEARADFNAQLKILTGKSLPDSELREAFSHVQFTYDPLKATLLKSANDAYTIGFLRQEPQLGGLYDLSALADVLRSKGLPPISQ